MIHMLHHLLRASTSCWIQDECSLVCPAPHRTQALPASTLWTTGLSALGIGADLMAFPDFSYSDCSSGCNISLWFSHSSLNSVLQRPSLLPLPVTTPWNSSSPGRLPASLVTLIEVNSTDFIPLIFSHISVLLPWPLLFCLDYSFSHLFISSNCVFSKRLLNDNCVLGTEDRTVKEKGSLASLLRYWKCGLVSGAWLLGSNPAPSPIS